MNVNPSSNDFGRVVPWDSLTDEQKASGDWIELPSVENEPRRAQYDGNARRARENMEWYEGILSSFRPSSDTPHRGEFDALGKPR